MFLGQFRHNLDDKGRLTIPARFRDLLAVEGGYILQGFDNNLMVLPASAFEAVTKRVNSMNMTDPSARMLRRLLFSSADQIGVDRVGRILLPAYLREAARLEGEAVIVGAGNYFEIWSPVLWEEQLDQLQDTEKNAQRFIGLELLTG